MQTVIDLPEPVLKEAKLAAEVRGIGVSELVTEVVIEALRKPEPPKSEAASRSPLPIPEAWANVKGPIRALSNAEVQEMFDQEDIERFLKSTRG